MAELSTTPRVLAIGRCGAALEEAMTNGLEVMTAPARIAAVALAAELRPDVIVVGQCDDEPSASELTRQLVQVLERTYVILIRDGTSEAAEGLTAGASMVVGCGDGGELRAHVDAMIRARREVDALIERTRDETLRQLAGAVAHRMNQPLTSMMVIVETLGAALSRGDLPPERLRSRLGELQRLVERMALIVKQVGNIDEYRTTDYVGGVKIIDIDEGRGR